MKKEMYFYGELDRFGFTFSAIDTDKKRLIKTIMDEYSRWYKDINGYDPKKEKSDRWYDEKRSMYQVALDDLEEGIYEYHAGEVNTR